MTERSRRILVTASDTTVGRAVIAQLLQDTGVESVLALHSRRGGPPRAWCDARVTDCYADIRHSRETFRLLLGEAREAGVDAVVHDLVHPHSTAEMTRHILQLCEEEPTIARVVLRSTMSVYRVDSRLPLLVDEDHALAWESQSPWLHDLVEGDLYACSHMSRTRLRLVVLRCAQVLAPNTGSELFDCLAAPVCLRPLGFDPMLNLLSPTDAARALVLALHCEGSNVFNIGGRDTLPLSELLYRCGRRSVPVPRALIPAPYRLRDNSVPNGTRARLAFGYEPQHRIALGALTSARRSGAS